MFKSALGAAKLMSFLIALLMQFSVDAAPIGYLQSNYTSIDVTSKMFTDGQFGPSSSILLADHDAAADKSSNTLLSGSPTTSEFSSLSYAIVNPMVNNIQVCKNLGSNVFRLNFNKFPDLEEFLAKNTSIRWFAWKSNNSTEKEFYMFDTKYQDVSHETGLLNQTYVILCESPPKSKAVEITLGTVGAVAFVVLGCLLHSFYKKQSLKSSYERIPEYPPTQSEIAYANRDLIDLDRMIHPFSSMLVSDSIPIPPRRGGRRGGRRRVRRPVIEPVEEYFSGEQHCNDLVFYMEK